MNSFRELWDYNKTYIFHVIRAPRREKKEGRAEKIL